METLQSPRFLGAVLILLLGIPLTSAQEVDTSCSCIERCIVWIIIAAIVPPVVIAGIAAIVKWCRWMNRKRMRIDNSTDEADEEKAEDPVYDFHNDFDDPDASTRPDLPKRRHARQSESSKISVTSTAEIVSENSREESGSNLNNEKSRRQRKKRRKLTDLGKESKIKTVQEQKSSSSSRSDSMRNTFSPKQRSTEKKLKKRNNEKTEAFSNLDNVQENDIDEIDDFTNNEERTFSIAEGRGNIHGVSGNLENALGYLDEVIALNDQDGTAGDSDDETNELQVLYEKTNAEKLRHNTVKTPSPAADFDLSRPNSPVPDEDVGTLFSAPSNNPPETQQRSVTPFPLISSGIKPKRKSKLLKSEDIIEETEEEYSMQLEANFSKCVVESKGSSDTDMTLNGTVNDPDNTLGPKRNMLNKTLNPNIPTRRATTPTPVSDSKLFVNTTERRSKTPNPILTKREKHRIIEVTEKKMSPISVFVSDVKDPPKTNISSHHSSDDPKPIVDKAEGVDNEKFIFTDKKLQPPRSRTPDPFSDPRSKLDLSKPKVADPFITDYSHSRAHVKQTDTDDNNLKTIKSLPIKSGEIPEKGFTEGSQRRKILKKQNSNTEFPDPKFLSPRSQTPDPFGNRMKARQDGQRVRSKTPDPLITTSTKKSNPKDGHANPSEKRLESLLRDSANLTGKSDILPDHEVLKDKTLSQLIRDASRRATTPDPDVSEQRGLVYNKLFSTDVRRSQSVPSKPVGTGKLLSRRGGSSNSLERNSKIEVSISESKGGSDDILKLNTGDKKEFSHTGLSDRQDRIEVTTKEASSTVTSEKHRLPFFHDQHKSPTADYGNNETDDRKIHSVNQRDTKLMTKAREDTFDEIMNTIEDHLKSAQTLADSETRKFRSKKDESVSEDNISRDNGARGFESTAAKLRARRQYNVDDTEELKDVTFHASTVSTEKLKEFRDNTFTQIGTIGFRTGGLSRAESLGSRETTLSDGEENQTYSGINRSKSVNERKLFTFEAAASKTSEEETRRKRKYSSLKLQLPDLTAVPKKSILKKATSPSSDSSLALDVIPLSQFVSSAKDGETNPSMLYQRGTKPRSIMFAGSPTMFGGNESRDNKVQRSFSYNERQQKAMPVSERPPTPGVFNRKKQKQDWKMSSTKF